MSKTRLTKISKLLLLLSFVSLSHCTLAQTTATSQGLWWEIEREFKTSNFDGWEAATYKATVPEFERPNDTGGRAFTVDDAVKGRYGQVTASGTATQSSFGMTIDSTLSVKSKIGQGASGEYQFKPGLYVEHGRNARLRITIRVTSSGEASVKVDTSEKTGAPLASSRADSHIRSVAAQSKEEGGPGTLYVSRDSVSGAKNPADTWKANTTVEEAHEVLVSEVGRRINGSFVMANPRAPWGEVARTQPDFYYIELAPFIERFYTKYPAVPTSVALGVSAEKGEASVTLKQELTITVERINPISAGGQNNKIVGRNFDPAKWKEFRYLSSPGTDSVQFKGGSQIVVVTSSDASPLPTMLFRFEVTAVPLNPDGTRQDSLATPGWFNPVEYSSGPTGVALHKRVSNKFVLQATSSSPRQLWTVSIPGQEDTHANFSRIEVTVYVRK